jgi:hypothetical protein
MVVQGETTHIFQNMLQPHCVSIARMTEALLISLGFCLISCRPRIFSGLVGRQNVDRG